LSFLRRQLIVPANFGFPDMQQRIFVFLLAVACLLQVESSLPKSRPVLSSAQQYPSTLELSEDGLSLMEPAIVPEPEDGGRWWYTPSRKAHIHSGKSKSRLMQSLMLSNKVNEDLRLPSDVLPSNYTIRLLPFIEEGNFTTDGHIDIFVDCVRDTNNISMNAADITFKNLSITVKIRLKPSRLCIFSMARLPILGAGPLQQ
jgi:hypothetical protein